MGSLAGMKYLRQRVGIDDVGDRLVRAGRPEVPGRLPPSPGLHAVLLAEQGHHDLGLLLAEAGQFRYPLEQLLAGLGLVPQPRRVAVVALDEQPADVLYPLGVGLREAVQRGRPGEDLDQLVRVELGQLVRGRLVTQALDQLVRGAEGPLQGYLLVAIGRRMYVAPPRTSCSGLCNLLQAIGNRYTLGTYMRR
jgi:hypothetical protein